MNNATPKISPASTTLQLWRISTYLSLDGTGAFRRGGRWNSPGRHVVYLAESPAGAMLETIVYLSLDALDLPDSYRLLRIDVPTGSTAAALDVPESGRWKDDAKITQKIGDVWLQDAKAALVRVPSVIVPYTWNYLINPKHPDANLFQVAQVLDHLHDPRLLRVRSL